VAQPRGKHDDSSSISTTRFDQGRGKDGNLEEEDEGGKQQVVEVLSLGSDKDITSISSVSDNNTRDLTSSSDLDVLLMSVDGHLVRAPLGLGNSEPSPLASDSQEVKKSGSSPQKLVCFEGVSDDEGTSLSADTHTLPENTVQQGMCTQMSDSTSDESDRHLLTDSSEGKPSNPGGEGLKGLAKLMEYDSLGAGQKTVGTFHPHNSQILPIETAPDRLGPHTENGETLEISGREESVIDGTDPKEFYEMRTMVFEKLEEEIEGLALNLSFKFYFIFKIDRVGP
jgi:hypothetical protein